MSMEARLFGATRPLARRLVFAAALTLVGLFCLGFLAPEARAAAGYRTTNFTVSAPTPQLAKEIGDAAEAWRKQLAMDWLGRELPRWNEPCPIFARVSPQLGAGGATSFVFDGGEVFGWDMKIQGSRERVLDSVLPHEITHTIFASHFRRPVPRWADEGACTTVEHRSEVSKQERMLMDFLRAGPGHPGRGIPFQAMFAMKEYPSDVLPLYAQGHSLAVYLIGQKGKQAFLEFLADGMVREDWSRAVRDHYGYEHLLALQNSWLDWVKAGRPALHPPLDGGAILASASVPMSGGAPASNASATAPADRRVQPAAAASPVTPESAGGEPTATSAAYGDWSTRPVRNAMASSTSSTSGGRAADGGTWR
jgi:hypothetical protein